MQPGIGKEMALYQVAAYAVQVDHNDGQVCKHADGLKRMTTKDPAKLVLLVKKEEEKGD